ncbi:type II secretion system protein GspG [Planctomycetota bacterium]|nr:type II secretion system protein GspG [Planctomycetota bacterium]
MLFTLALAAALTPLTPQETPGLHPDTAEFVLSVPDLQGTMGSYGKTAMAKMMADADLQSAIGEVMGSGPVDPVELLVQQLRGMEGEFPPILDMHQGVQAISMSLDFLGDADLLSAIFTLGFPSEEPQIAIRWVVDFEDETSCAAWVETLMDYTATNSAGLPESMKPKLSTRALTLQGDGGSFGAASATINSMVGMEGSLPQYIVQGGTRAVLIAGTEDIDAELQRMSGVARGMVSEQIAAGRAKLGESAGVRMVEAYVSPYAGINSLMESMESGAGLTETLLLGPGGSMLELMMGAPASAMIRGGHWDVSILEGGRFSTRGWIPGESPSPGLDMIGGSPIQASSLGLAHPDALVTAVASFDPAMLLDMVTEAAPDPESVEAMMSQLEQQFGFRVDRDVIAPLGDSISYSLPKLRSLLSAPNLMAVAELEDRETFTRGMDGLVGMIKELGEIEGQRTDYRGATLYSWSLADAGGGGMQGGGLMAGLPIDPSTFVRPTITVMDDRVLFSTLPTHAKREVRRVAKLLKAGEKATLHAGLVETGIADGASMVNFADWPLFMGNLYTQLKALAPMLGGLAGGGGEMDLPFQLEALPDMTVLTRHFRPSARYSLALEGGRMDVTESSIGPEVSMLMGIAAIGGASVLGASAGFDGAGDEWDDEEMVIEFAGQPLESEEGVEPGPTGQTQSSLMGLSMGIQMFQVQNEGKAPASLAELQGGGPSEPGTIKELPSDGWGRGFKYSNEGGKVRIWSIGANGIDENGEGDDLLLEL